MNIYTNAFRLATKADGDEFIITLLQNAPRYDDNFSIIGDDSEIVGAYVMTMDFAKNLAIKINELLSIEDDKNAASE